MAPLSHLLQHYRRFSAIMVFVCVSSLPLIASQHVRVTIEAPGQVLPTNRNIAFAVGEGFNNIEGWEYDSWSTDFESKAWIGEYLNLKVALSDAYGGANRWGGYYPYTDPDRPITLMVTPTEVTQGRVGPTYFGLWISYMKLTDKISFYQKGHLLFYINMLHIWNFLNASDQRRGYFRNPFTYFQKSYYRGFAFVNFYLDAEYDEVRFAGSKEWFCSDNHLVGIWRRITGDVIYTEEITPPPTTANL